MAKHHLSRSAFDRLQAEYDDLTTRGRIEVANKIQVPTFLIGASHDIFQRDEPLLYEQMKNRVNTKLVIVPGAHVQAVTGAFHANPTLNRPGVTVEPQAGPGAGHPHTHTRSRVGCGPGRGQRDAVRPDVRRRGREAAGW